MITEIKQPQFVTSDGTKFDTREEAQIYELAQLFGDSELGEDAAARVMKRAEEVIAILTGKPAPKPRKPRKDKGTIRARPPVNDMKQ